VHCGATCRTNRIYALVVAAAWSRGPGRAIRGLPGPGRAVFDVCMGSGGWWGYQQSELWFTSQLHFGSHRDTSELRSNFLYFGPLSENGRSPGPGRAVVDVCTGSGGSTGPGRLTGVQATTHEINIGGQKPCCAVLAYAVL
jgi:hypothetical protein